MQLTVAFGYPDRESLKLLLTLPASDDFISARAAIQAGGFQGTVDLYLNLGCLVRFAEEVQELYRTLRGEAVLVTLEGQISIRMTGDAKGHITLKGSLRDGWPGNDFRFTLNFDQTFLQQTLNDLNEAVRQASS